MSEQQVRLDEVGVAEDLLRRLIQERRVLENAAVVLETYKKVVSQLQPAEEALAKVSERVVEARRQLDGVEELKRVSAIKMEEEMKEYRDRLVKQAEEEMDLLMKELAALKGDEEAMNTALMLLDKKHNERVLRYEEEIKALEAKLEGSRKEHGALAEAIEKAADFFKRME